MNSPSKFLETMILSISNADKSIYQKSPRHNKLLIMGFGLSLLFSSIAGGVAIAAFMIMLTGLVPIGLIVGSAVGGFIFFHDSSFLRHRKWIMWVFGILIAVIMGAIFSFPMKTYFAQDQLKAVVIKNTLATNEDLLLENVTFIDQDYNTLINEANKKIVEVSGMTSNGQWYPPKQKQNAINHRDSLTALRERLISQGNEKFNRLKVVPDTSFMGLMNIYWSSDNKSNATKTGVASYLDLALLILFIFLESSPAIIRFFLIGSVYERKIVHKNQMLHEQSQKVMEAEENIMDERSSKELRRNALERELSLEKYKQVENDFEDYSRMDGITEALEHLNDSTTEDETNDPKTDNSFSENGQAKEEDIPNIIDEQF